MPDKNKPDKPLRGATVPPPENDGELPERWEVRKQRVGFFGGLIRLLVLGIVLTALILPFTPYASRVKRGLEALVDRARETKVVFRDVPKKVVEEKTVVQEKTVFQEKLVKVEVPAPPPPLPSQYVPRKDVDVATFFNDIVIQTKLDTEPGTFASLERLNKDAFTVQFQVKVRIPKASDTLPELTRVNASLPKVLPGLEAMLKTAKVSGFYHKLYDKKSSVVQQNLTRLNKILDRHNFFDCETILELSHPETKRKTLLIQSEMDVVSDGSDGDRMPEMSPDIYNSDYYQPFTSYEWAKKSTTQNPLLPRWQARLEAAKKQVGTKGISNARNNELKAEVQQAETIIRGLKNRSSLIAEKDPFIVVSLIFRDYTGNHPYAPAMGDYAAVIHGDKIYPAICGDYGPSMKMGEASLMMAKQLNAQATPYKRPESDLKVTYLIFPDTAEKPFGPPNLEKWHEKVSGYLAECGGLGAGYTLHKWENPFPPPAPPAPAETTPLTPPVLGGAPTTPPAPGAPAIPASGSPAAPAAPGTPAPPPAGTIAPPSPSASSPTSPATVNPPGTPAGVIPATKSK